MGWEVTLRFQDAFGRTTRRTWQSDRANEADVTSDVATLITTIEATMGCRVIESKVSKVTIVAGSPVAGSNIDAGATLRVRLDNNKVYGIHLPGFDTSLCDVDGSVILGGTEVQALFAQFESAGHFLLSETNYATALIGGELDT